MVLPCSLGEPVLFAGAPTPDRDPLVNLNIKLADLEIVDRIWIEKGGVVFPIDFNGRLFLRWVLTLYQIILGVILLRGICRGS